VLFAADIHNPHATAFAALTPFADASTAMSCLVMLHSIWVKNKAAWQYLLPTVQARHKKSPNNGQYPHTNHRLDQCISLATCHKKTCLIMTAEQFSGFKMTYHKLAVCAFAKAHLQANTYD
jgi:hypothetical protein